MAGQSGLATDLTVPLDPAFDQFGSQIETIQAFTDNGGTRVTSGIYDTGASVVTFSYMDQFLWQMGGTPIPVKVANGAGADGVGGGVTGDISQPGTIQADGIHAMSFDFSNLLNPIINYDWSQAVSVAGVQTFLGNENSQSLPTITGMPIHNVGPDPVRAAKIDMVGYQFDLAKLFPELNLGPGLVISMPDLHFVAPNSPGAALTGSAGVTTDPVRIPLSPYGPSNHPNPGNDLTVAPNPLQSNVGLSNVPDPLNPSNVVKVSAQKFLLDTGAQLTIISPSAAASLGLDLNNPSTSIAIQGAAGTEVDVPGYTIKSLAVPLAGGQSGTLTFTDVPVYVADLGITGVDGILGMNLFNTANEMLYDPSDPAHPYLDVTFLTDPNRNIDSELAALGLVSNANPLFASFAGSLRGHSVPGITPNVPEPSTLVLLLVAVASLPLLWRRR